MVGNNNSTFIQLPADITNPLELRRFLDKMVQQLDIAFGNRGDESFVSDSTFLSGVNSIQELINRLNIENNKIWAEFDNGINMKVVTTTSSLNAEEFTETILCDCSSNDINVKLPNPTKVFEDSRSRVVSVSKIDSSTNKVTILPYNNEDVVMSNSVDLLLQGEIVNLITDGTNWYLGA